MEWCHASRHGVVMTPIHPPRFAAMLLSWLLNDDWDTPAGDFEEYFHEMVESRGERWARQWYRMQVLTLLPGRLTEKTLWSTVMLFKNLRVAMRAMRRHAGTAAVNVGGLALGLAAVLLIGLFMQDELTYDSVHGKSDRIVRIVEASPTPTGDVEHLVYTMNPLGPTVAGNVPGVELSTRMFSAWTLGRQTLTVGDVSFYEGDYLTVDSTFFELFDYTLTSGNPSTALHGPNQVVLTASAARKYFGADDPMGKVLSFQWQGDMEVTGVMEDPPSNTHLQFSMLVSMATLVGDARFGPFIEDWATQNSITYLLLEPQANLESVQSAVDAIVAASVPAGEGGATRTVQLQPMNEIHFGSSYITFDYNAGARSERTIYILGLIGLFILLIAVINYTNLTTVISVGRAREIGMRLAVGAHRSQLVKQFLSESVVTTVVAAAIGLILARLGLPVFNSVMEKSLSMSPSVHPALLPVLFILVVILGLVAGSYPAGVMSRFLPARVLKGGSASIKGSQRVRNGLVITQFTLSIGLILASLVVYQQLVFFQQADLGFNADQVVIVDINSGAARNGYEAIKADMLADPGVSQVSVSSNIPGDWKNISEIDVRASESGSEELASAFFLGVDADFIPTYEIELLEGRNFVAGNDADSLAVLLTESTAQMLGVGIGERISVPGASLRSRFADTEFNPMVIGIVGDFNFQSLHESIDPMVLGYWTNPIDVIDYFSVRVSPQNIPQTIAALEVVGKRHDPETPFEFNFLDERIQEFYEADSQLGRLVGFSTALAILIACLGLFALTAYSTALRTKEIGVRKVLGASVASVVLLLSRDILRLVAVAFVLAAPIAWFAVDAWLNTFAFRISPGWGTLLMTAAVTFLLAFLTIAWQALKAASNNPVDSLRWE